MGVVDYLMSLHFGLHAACIVGHYFFVFVFVCLTSHDLHEMWNQIKAGNCFLHTGE